MSQKAWFYSLLVTCLFYIGVALLCGCDKQTTHSERLSGVDQLTDQDRAELQNLINNLPEE